MKEWLIGGICAVVIMAACAVPWGRIGGSSTPSSAPSPVGTASPSPPPGIDPEKKLREVIERTKGDYTQVTDNEKRHLDQLTTGHGQRYFEYRVNQWKQEKKMQKSGRPSTTVPPKGTEKGSKTP